MSAGYEALATKVKAMYGKRLRYADYVRLARMASVSEIYADLRQHPVWGPAVAGWTRRESLGAPGWRRPSGSRWGRNICA